MSNIIKKLYHKLISPKVYAIVFDCDKDSGWLTIRGGYTLEEVRENIKETHKEKNGHETCNIEIKRYVKEELEVYTEEFSEGNQNMKAMKE